MVTPKVSVIIPAYNSERFIGETLDSVFNQTYKDFEVVVVDDGSSDGTDRVVSQYKDRLTYIKKKNEGISIARNRAIAIARGEYVAFIDHDDLWLPDKLEEQIGLLERDKQIRLCFSDAYVIDENGTRNSNLFNIYLPHSGMVFKQLLRGNFIPVLTAVIRKDVFQEVGLFNPRYRIAEDWDLFLRISERYPVAFINQPLAEYRIHDKSFSRQRHIVLTEVVSILDLYIDAVDDATAAILKKRRQRFEFALGMVYLQRGLKKKARDYFVDKVGRESFSFCFYLGMLITYLPLSWSRFIARILSSKGTHDYYSSSRK